jgi:hypothetical protein
MILWTKIKIDAAVGAIAVLAAGAGSIILIEARAGSPAAPPPPPALPAPPVVQVAPSLCPFTSPFLELVGCRVKETANLMLSPQPQPPLEVTWTQQQYPIVLWTLSPDLAASVAHFSITIIPTSDPVGSQNILADKSASLQALRGQLGGPGDYKITISALDAGSRAIASAEVHAIITALPITQIMINDIQPDATIRYTSVMQYLNPSNIPITQFGFFNSDVVHTSRIVDDEGTSLRFDVVHSKGNYRFHVANNHPIQPGDAMMSASMGTETRVIQPQSAGILRYVFRHSPGANQPVHRVELFRLPPGAVLTYSSDNLKSRNVAGQTQLYMETTIRPGGSNLIEFRYRLGT